MLLRHNEGDAMNRLALRVAIITTFVAALLAAGCGGGDPAPDASERWAHICTPEGEKNFTRSYLEKVYLWYREIPVIDAAPYTNIGRYFHDLLTPALDASGQRKDRFSFVVTATDADSLLTGATTSYGVQWQTDAQGRRRAAYIEQESPAQTAGLTRGAELVTVLTPGSPDWFPNAAAQISFVYRSAPGAPTATLTLSSVALQEDPLPQTRTLVSAAGHKVAYLLFNAHTWGAQDKLIAALTGLQQSSASDLVLDMRYNRGGFLYTALSLSSMLTGPQSDGRVFEQLQFNDKRNAETQASVLDFAGQLQVGETAYAAGSALPRLALPRVFVLTTGNTCSASESVINSLRGVGVEVVLVGSATCGKPYGFSRKDNCGLAYFPIEFQGVNDQGLGDYAGGFPPTCAVPDDFDHALGDSGERLLATALGYVDSGSCPQPAARAKSSAPQPDFGDGRWRRPGKVLLPRP